VLLNDILHPILVGHSVISYYIRSAPSSYVMMRQPLFKSLTACNILPCQSGDSDTCSSCTAEVQFRYDRCWYAGLLQPFSPFPLDIFFGGRFSPDVQTQYSVSKGPVCPWSPPRFWPQSLPGLPCRPSFQTTGCTATAAPISVPDPPILILFSGWLRRPVHPRSLGDYFGLTWLSFFRGSLGHEH
jgi:hypothetical protein